MLLLAFLNGRYVRAAFAHYQLLTSLQILDTLESAEMIINPTAGKPNIDRSLVADNRSVRQRIASAKLSMQVGERMVTKTMTRMAEWRRTIRESEKKRLRKNLQDM